MGASLLALAKSIYYYYYYYYYYFFFFLFNNFLLQSLEYATYSCVQVIRTAED